LLSLAAGVLALNALQVHVAEVRAHSGVAVDTFTVSPKFGRLPDTALLREQLSRAVDGSLPLSEQLVTKERDYGGPPADVPPPTVLWFDDEASAAIVLELRAADRIGLLHAVAATLESCGVDVRWARVATLGPTVVGSFCLAPGDDSALSLAQRRRIERAVRAAAR
jgi:[protein-PII] uridylyltransferase